MLQPDEQVNFLVGISHLCKVKENKPGEITLRVGLTDLPRLSLKFSVPDPGAEIKRIPGYMSHRIRTRLTGVDVEIRYDPSVFPFELWKDLASLRDNPSLEPKVKQALHALMNGDRA